MEGSRSVKFHVHLSPLVRQSANDFPQAEEIISKVKDFCPGGQYQYPTKLINAYKYLALRIRLGAIVTVLLVPS